MAKRIMVINDTQEILELFELILTDAGYRVTLHAYSTRDLDEVTHLMPDLIISDHIPFKEQQGWQFLQKLKMLRETATIPVIVCTTSSELVRENEGWLKGKGVTIVAKPFDIDELLHAVELAIGKANEP